MMPCRIQLSSRASFLSNFPAWVASLGVEPTLWYGIYYGIQPLILLAFYVEHRKWLAAARRVDPQFAR